MFAAFRARTLHLILAVLYLAAVLLPGPAVAAAPAGPTEIACGGALQATATPQIVSADQQVPIPDATLDTAIFEANARQTLKGLDLARSVVLSEFIIQLRDKGETGDIERVMEEYSAAADAAWAAKGANFKEAYAGETYDRLVHTMLDVALASQTLKRHASAVWSRITLQGRNTARLGGASRQVIDNALGHSLAVRVAELVTESFRTARGCAAGDSATARAFDKTAGKKLGVSITDRARTVVKKRPALAIPPQITQLIEANNTIAISLNELKALSKTEFDKLHGAIGDMQETLAVIDAKQDVLIDYINNQQERAAMEALAAAEAAETRLSLDAFRSSISVLHTLAGFVDPELAGQIAVVGDSAIQIADSLNGWLTAVSGMDTLTDVGALSTVIMTGNVLGAVMNVVSLFGDSEPTPDQMILQEIGRLRQEVSELRTEMHERFDRIDAELNAIYTTMQERFDLIDIELGKINGKLDAIQESLLALDLRLSRLERNTFELIDAVGRRPLLEAINGGLRYQERTGLPMPYEPQFVDFENALHTWGVLHAYDALAIGPSQRDYSPGALLRELNTYPMDANLNYLDGWLRANGLPPIANKVIASPRDWMLAARAYTQLGSEWPQHMRRINPDRQRQLDAAGADIETALRNLTASPAGAGSQGSGAAGNEVIFTGVISYYQGALDRLDAGIQPLEANYVLEVQTQQLGRAEPFNLYGGIDQPLAFQSPGLRSMTYGDGAALLPAPANLPARIEGFNRFNAAEYFAISPTVQMTATMSSVLLGGRPAPGCKPDPDVCPLIGNLRVQVRALAGPVLLAQWELDAGQVTLPVVGGDVEEPAAYTARRWGNLQPRFEQEAQPVALTPEQAAARAALYGELGGALEARLGSYQQTLYRRILGELNAGSLQGAAAEVAGARSLLDNVATLGLAHAVSSDDLLHAMLYGNQRLVDAGQVMQTYAISGTQPITGTALLSNPRLALDRTAEARRLAFGGMVDKYLAAIAAQTHVETLDYVGSTRRALDLTMRITQVADQPAPSASQLFLPQVRR